MMTAGQAKKMDEKLGKLQKDTGYKVRVLTQAYPETPGWRSRTIGGWTTTASWYASSTFIECAAALTIVACLVLSSAQ